MNLVCCNVYTLNSMGKKISVFFFTFAFLVFGLLLAGKVYACEEDADCTDPTKDDYCHPPASCTGESAYCDGNGVCHCTWYCPCDCGWGDWRECIDGYTTRYCTCNSTLYQISTCVGGSPSPSPSCTKNAPVMDVKIDNADGPVARAEPASYTVTWSRTGGDAGDSCTVKENEVQFSTSESGSQPYSNKMLASYNYSASCSNCDGTGSDTATANVSGSGLIQGRRVNGSCLDAVLFNGNPTVNPGPVPVAINDVSQNNNGIWDTNWEIYSTGVGGVGMGQTYTVSVAEPTGYDAYYSVCNNCISHLDGSYVLGNSVSVTVPSVYADGLTFAYVDLYWKYVPETMTVSGRVVKDPGQIAGMYCGGLCGFAGNCSGGDNWTVADGGGFNITASGCNGDSGVTAVGGDGNYSVGLPYSLLHTVVINSLTTNWINFCPGNGIYSNITTSVGVNYYVTLQKDPWWQAEEGNVHADNGNVGSSIPDTADLPFLITGLVPGLVSYTGSLDVGNTVAINQAGLSNWQAQTGYQGLKTDYGYFKRILEDDPLDFGVWPGGKPASNGVFLGNGASETSGGNWTINNGEVYVILVPNSVTINNNINVNPGGFLAIISSGNITIGNEVTNVEGVYVADGIISSGTSESQLIGEGIFTGWLGIDLRRDFNTIQNNTTPAEKFIYRPDLVRNAYHYLLKPKISWQEVAP